jgi:hypothetical protein
MKRPTFFISSTIYDFRDLRDSLKFLLERQGCRVLASEYNDFEKPLDKHSYDACLAAIEQADYFVLLIGSRVGGWYDKANRISITQQEYRVAYELQREGKLRLISFVRGELWNLKEFSNRLASHLANVTNVELDIRENILSFPTRFATDAAFIINFMEEVAKNAETKEALDGKRELPIGNWIHTYSNFNDIVDVIEPILFKGDSLEVASARAALKAQVRSLLKASLIKITKNIMPPFSTVDGIVNKLKISRSEINGTTEATVENIRQLEAMSVLVHHRNPRPETLETTLQSPLLLKYDATKGAFESTYEYNNLAKLVDSIHIFLEHRNRYDSASKHDWSNISSSPPGSIISVPTIRLVRNLMLLISWAEMIELAQKLARSLDGLPSTCSNCVPKSPFYGEEERLSLDDIHEHEIDDFIGA